MQASCNIKEFENDIIDLVKLFSADISVYVDVQEEKIAISIGDKTYINIIASGVSTMDWRSNLKEKRFLKRAVKLAVYDSISSYLDVKLPWGSLTGIRPTKLVYDLLEEGMKPHLIKETLVKDFKVSSEKADLVAKIIKNQNCIIRNDKLIDFYVNIPICPTRCAYCSFISAEMESAKGILSDYLDALIREIRAAKEIINKKAYVVRTIYIGGGTPSVLSAGQLDMLLSELTYPVNEITVECGRPDTITEEKLAILKKHGVSRISINPQTFCAATLKRIGRNHTIKDIKEAYKLAMKFGFVVNMDVIAGLPGEKTAIFKRTIDTLLEFFPENITVHTLSLKNGSELVITNGDGLTKQSQNEVSKMLSYANKKLIEEGYKPYYLYRQKNQLGGLENVGYFRDNHICIFNVDSMEETCSVIACGANAISKRVYNIENRIEREANVKFLKDYVERIDEMLERKKKLF